MALIVKLFINEREIASYAAVRKRGLPHALCTYEINGEELIDHHYDDGAESLAAKVLLTRLVSRGTP